MAGRRQTLRAERFAAWLKVQRGSRTQEQVAFALQALNVTCGASKLGKMEAEGRLPSVDVLWGLANVYGVPLEKIIELIARDLNLGQRRRRAEDIEQRRAAGG